MSNNNTYILQGIVTFSAYFLKTFLLLFKIIKSGSKDIYNVYIYTVYIYIYIYIYTVYINAVLLNFLFIKESWCIKVCINKAAKLFSTLIIIIFLEHQTHIVIIHICLPKTE